MNSTIRPSHLRIFGLTVADLDLLPKNYRNMPVVAEPRENSVVKQRFPTVAKSQGATKIMVVNSEAYPSVVELENGFPGNVFYSGVVPAKDGDTVIDILAKWHRGER